MLEIRLNFAFHDATYSAGVKLLYTADFHFYLYIVSVQSKINSVKADIAAVSRKVYLSEDEVSKAKEKCEELERGKLI